MIAVARQGDRSQVQVARSFGISESCLNRWMKIADRQDGVNPNGINMPSGALAGRGGGLEAEKRDLRRATAYFARDTLRA